MVPVVDATEFQRLLRNGLGRAILHARDHDVGEFRDIILEACLHTPAYDVQLEGSRAFYMHDLVGMLPDRDFYHGEVLRSLRRGGDDRDTFHRFQLATHLASAGDGDSAKRAMYDAYQPGPNFGDVIGTFFLQLDGIPGFLFAAERIGSLQEGYLLSQAFEAFGEEATWTALQQAGEESRDIETYRTVAWERTIRDREKQQSCAPAVETLGYPGILEEKSPSRLAKWGAQASDGDIQLAADGLLAATDPARQLAHLRIFRERRYPSPDLGLLFELAGSDDRRMANAALSALENVTDPAVRSLALRLMETGSNLRGRAADLLVNNFEPGDHDRVLGWFRKERDVEVRHNLGFNLPRFWDRNPDDVSRSQMLLALYEYGPCSLCREVAVRRLIEINSLPDAIRKECEWDSSEEIRELVRGTSQPGDVA